MNIIKKILDKLKKWNEENSYIVKDDNFDQVDNWATDEDAPHATDEDAPH